MLCLSLPDLLIETVLRARPALAGIAVVVGGAPSEPRPVVACSAEAASAGVRQGMRLKEAQSRCPEAIFLPEMPEQLHAAVTEIAALLEQFSPSVEAADGGLFFLDLQGLRLLWPREDDLAAELKAALLEHGPYAARIGIAGSKYAALVATLQSDVWIVPPGEDALFLEKQPIDRLPAPAPILAALQSLGIETLGEFAALPPNAAVMRFGKEARQLQLLARGFDEARVISRPYLPRIEARIVFEGGETASDRLLWIMNRRLVRLYRQLERATLVARELHLTLSFEDGSTLREALPLHDPLLNLPQLQRLLGWYMEGLELPGPVVEVALELAGLAPVEGRQLDLFARRQAGSVRRLLSELAARWGMHGFRQPRIVQSRRVEETFAWDDPAPRYDGRLDEEVGFGSTPLEPRPLLRLLPKPRPVRVIVRDEQPTVLVLGQRKERIVAVGGPWRLCESWWDTPLERDEYQLATATGVYYVMHDRIADAWLLLGAFD